MHDSVAVCSVQNDICNLIIHKYWQRNDSVFFDTTSGIMKTKHNMQSAK